MLSTATIYLHCDHEACSGIRAFRRTESYKTVNYQEWKLDYLDFQCSNCRSTNKTFSVAMQADDAMSGSGKSYKFGEMPPFSPRTPAKLMSMIGGDRELFLKGRRCEAQSLGIGAFTYYRRMVENQRTRIIEEMIRVAKTLQASNEMIADLRTALHEKQFTKSLEIIKVPDVLRIGGHNPMALLHDALSSGVHQLSDDECLERAGHIRIVLSELSERVTQVLKDDAELKKAVSGILALKSGDRRG